jgi:sensor histidine kinase YesM
MKKVLNIIAKIIPHNSTVGFNLSLVLASLILLVLVFTILPGLFWRILTPILFAYGMFSMLAYAMEPYSYRDGFKDYFNL